jgi:hypothetical protein
MTNSAHEDLKQIHLTGDTGYSWRGVRLRPLDPDAVDEVSMSAARDAGEDARRFAGLKERGALVRMIAAVTAPDTGKAEAAAARAQAIKATTDAYQEQIAALQKRIQGGDGDAPALLAAAFAECASKARTAGDAAAEGAAFTALQSARWVPCTPLELGIKGQPNSFARLFTPKDAAVLGVAYRNEYEARIDEAQAIMGKALAVSGG